MFSRRALLKTVSFVPFAGLVACTSTQNLSANLATAAQNVNAIASGLANAAKILTTMQTPGVPTSFTTQVQSAATAVATEAVAISSAATASSAQPVMLQVENVVNALITTAATIPALPPNIKLILAAAAVVLPVAEQALNMAVSAITQANASAGTTVVNSAPVTGALLSAPTVQEKALLVLTKPTL